MSMIDITYRIEGNKLIITPDEGIRDSAKYIIKVNNILSVTGQSCNIDETIITAMSPLYADIIAVKSLIDSVGVPDHVILYHIKEASQFVEYIKNASYDDGEIPFEVRQYVKYKAAIESLLTYLASRSTYTSTKGVLNDIQFERSAEDSKDLKDLIDLLRDELKRWEDELNDFKRRGPASPASSVKSSTPKYGTMENAYERGGFIVSKPKK